MPVVDKSCVSSPPVRVAVSEFPEESVTVVLAALLLQRHHASRLASTEWVPRPYNSLKDAAVIRHPTDSRPRDPLVPVYGPP